MRNDSYFWEEYVHEDEMPRVFWVVDLAEWRANEYSFLLASTRAQNSEKISAALDSLPLNAKIDYKWTVKLYRFVVYTQSVDILVVLNG